MLEAGRAHALGGDARAARARSSSSSRGSRASSRRGPRTRPSPCRSRATWSAGASSSFSQTRSSLATERLLERRVAVLEDGAGVHQRRVEHPREQLVAEVVVRGDRLAAAPRRVAQEDRARRAAAARARTTSRRRSRSSAVDVAGGDADHVGQVAACPSSRRRRTRPSPRLPRSSSARQTRGDVHVHGARSGAPCAERPASRPSSTTVSCAALEPPQQRRARSRRGAIIDGCAPGCGWYRHALAASARSACP